MKASAIALALCCLALSGHSETRVDLTAVIGKDFIGSPSLDQAAEALAADQPLLGFGWDVVLGHIGLGGEYLIDFNEETKDAWTLDWQGQAIYASYHFLGARMPIDPFVDAGLGCAGRVFLGPAEATGDRLTLTLYPFASAGAALELQGLRVGAKLSYALDRSPVPVTSIPLYPLGRFQVSAFAGVSIGGH
jgi:hypothetical protein